MVQKTIKVHLSDLSGAEVETGPGKRPTVPFSWKGSAYEIDLTDAEKEAFEEVMKPYMKAGRRVPKS